MDCIYFFTGLNLYISGLTLEGGMVMNMQGKMTIILVVVGTALALFWLGYHLLV
ncbi:hypothetical protein GCM10008935_07620 [Alkalibacillus silvisoli]|uniref:Uncharacterized protein n=1 Tax=Alkalibacillus silvisoli TaxID=392823 RepID=A0ABN0ZQ34_9BACI